MRNASHAALVQQGFLEQDKPASLAPLPPPLKPPLSPPLLGADRCAEHRAPCHQS